MAIYLSGNTQIENHSIGFKYLPGIASIYSIDNMLNQFSRFAGGYGLEYQFRLNENVCISSGFYYLDKGLKLNSNLTNQNGDIIGLIHSKEINYYLTIPINIQVYVKKYYFGVGGSLNYFHSRKFIVEDTISSTDKSYQPNNFLFAINIYTGRDFYINEKIKMSLDIFFNPVFKVKYINYGIGIGFNYLLYEKEKE